MDNSKVLNLIKDKLDIDDPNSSFMKYAKKLEKEEEDRINDIINDTKLSTITCDTKLSTHDYITINKNSLMDGAIVDCCSYTAYINHDKFIDKLVCTGCTAPLDITEKDLTNRYSKCKYCGTNVPLYKD